ncbi:hypothetical protein F4778DRAFT_691852 [Xylariomycetidae sp. FL2044]|nr:hypothetical protein F4778DRAFT_691852 [Xylariomycetidae sp. FL2044]
MPSLDPDTASRVLVTGGNGFIGGHVVKQLLETTPYEVVATVRSEAKATKLRQTHGDHARLATAVVPDITRPDAYLAAASGCAAIVHLAAPFGYAYADYETELLIPAIAGTEAAVAAADATPSVRRIVYCSSFAAVYDGGSAEGMAPSRVYTEADFSPLTYEDGRGATATPVAYRASKVLAEKRAWAACRAQDRWDLVSLCPGMVFGAPLEGTLEGVAGLNTSNALIWGLLDKAEVPPTKSTFWTAVVSLAEAHVSALSSPDAGNERFLLLSGDYDNQEMCDVIRNSTTVNEAVKSRVPVGKPGDRPKTEIFKADGRKASKFLNFSKVTLEDAVVELLNYVAAIENS